MTAVSPRPGRDDALGTRSPALTWAAPHLPRHRSSRQNARFGTPRPGHPAAARNAARKCCTGPPTGTCLSPAVMARRVRGIVVAAAENYPAPACGGSITGPACTRRPTTSTSSMPVRVDGTPSSPRRSRTRRRGHGSTLTDARDDAYAPSPSSTSHGFCYGHRRQAAAGLIRRHLAVESRVDPQRLPAGTVAQMAHLEPGEQIIAEAAPVGRRPRRPARPRCDFAVTTRTRSSRRTRSARPGRPRSINDREKSRVTTSRPHRGVQRPRRLRARHKGMTSRDLTENVEQHRCWDRYLVRSRMVTALVYLARLAETYSASRSPVVAQRRRQVTTLGKRFASAADELLVAYERVDGSSPATRCAASRPGRYEPGHARPARRDTAKLAELETRVARHLGFERAFTSTAGYPRSLTSTPSARWPGGRRPSSLATSIRLMAGASCHRGLPAGPGRLVCDAAQDEHPQLRARQRLA